MVIHTAEKGDTAESIARRYGVDAGILAFDNDAESLPYLPEGMAVAVVQPEITHRVSEGDSLFSVAQAYGTDLQTLWRNNMFLNGGAELTPGETLYIRTRRSPLGALRTGGYAYPFIPEKLLRRYLPFLSAVMPFTYGFTERGALLPPDDSVILRACGSYGSAPVMHLSTLNENDVFSAALAEKLLYDPGLRRGLLDSVLENMQSRGYTALDADLSSSAKKTPPPTRIL